MFVLCVCLSGSAGPSYAVAGGCARLCVWLCCACAALLICLYGCMVVWLPLVCACVCLCLRGVCAAVVVCGGGLRLLQS